MSQASSRPDPLSLLRRMEQRSRQAEARHRPPVPSDRLSAIGFVVGGQRLLLALDEMHEVYNYAQQPKPSPVPGAPPSLKGMASRRGQLLPIIDLAALLLKHPLTPDREARVLILKHSRAAAGLLVEAVAGLKHLDRAERVTEGPPFQGRTVEFLSEVYQQDGQYWGRLSLTKLLRDPDVRKVAGVN